MIPDARRVAGRRFLLLSLITLVALTAVRAADPRLVADIRNEWFDGLQRLAPREAPPLPVRVVDVDEAGGRITGEPRSFGSERLSDGAGAEYCHSSTCALGAASMAI